MDSKLKLPLFIFCFSCIFMFSIHIVYLQFFLIYFFDGKKTKVLPKAVLQFIQVCFKVYTFNKMDGIKLWCGFIFTFTSF